MSKRPELLIVNGDLAGKRFAVGDGGLKLGRSSSNDIFIPDGQLSRNHCLFEPVGEAGLRVTDLASANGTILNGAMLGSDAAELHAGDVVEVGATTVKVVGEEETPAAAADAGTVDLGLDGAKNAVEAQTRRRSPVANVLWVVVVLLAACVAYLIMTAPTASEPAAAPAAAADPDPVLKELHYEKVEADSGGIFRYELTLSPDGVLSVAVDDVPKENRHLHKHCRLDERALAELNEIVNWRHLREIDREYAGVEPDPPELDSWSLKVVYTSRVRTVRVVNTQEPEAFRSIREKLEAFSKNQLGVWALQYSREKLIELAQEKIAVGGAKWADREVQYGNLFEAVAAYNEAIFYLETVNPKPDCIQTARGGLEEARSELDRRYRDQRFAADRAINLKQWELAKRELEVLMEMVPDREDDRYREASAKLLDVEKRIKGGK